MVDHGPAVQTHELTRVYPGGLRALDGVTLSIENGELVAIMGPSGSGKSTLLNLLGALDRPTSGQIAIAGQRLDRVRDLDRFRSRTVGFVFQLHNLIPTLSAEENVMVPLFEEPISGRERARRAREILEQVGLTGFGKLPGQLSGGERQRVAIARALVNRPALVLADEPTGSLDSQTGAEIIALLQRLNAEHGVTILLVTHDPVVALSTRRIVTLRDGRVDDDEPVDATYRADLRALGQTPLGRLILGRRVGRMGE